MTDKIHGSIIRERASILRGIGAALTRKFHASQHGAIRPGLTIDDGSIVVTDNYLKVRIPPGRVRNEWVTIAVTANDSGLVGAVL